MATMIDVARSISYTDALNLLREPGSRFAEIVDRLTASGMLGAVVQAPDILGWLMLARSSPG